MFTPILARLTMFRCGKKKCTLSVCSLLLVAGIYLLVANLFLENEVKDNARSVFIENGLRDNTPDVFLENGLKDDALNYVAEHANTNELQNKGHINNNENFAAINEQQDECDWLDFKVEGPPYFLTVVFSVRIYESDKSELKSTHLKQWLTYLRYSGVEHIYLYDLWYLPGESQREELDYFIQEGFLTYTDRHDLNPFQTQKSLIPALQQGIDEHGHETTWQAHVDIDEYPFSSEDADPGFLYRFVKKYSEAHPGVSEVTMDNFLYLGQKDDTKELLMDKLWRHTHGPANNLVKPIYKPADIKSAQVHHNHLRRGKSERGPNRSIRINHYWGARLQNWGPDTKEILDKTEEDRGMEPIVNAFKTCRPYLHI